MLLRKRKLRVFFLSLHVYDFGFRPEAAGRDRRLSGRLDSYGK